MARYKIEGRKLRRIDDTEKPDPRLRDAAEMGPPGDDAIHDPDKDKPKRRQRRNSVAGQGLHGRVNGSKIWRVTE